MTPKRPLGRPALPANERRDVVPVRLSRDELEALDGLRGPDESRGRAVARLVAEAVRRARRRGGREK